MEEKICIFCEHFYFEPADPGYSEYTPGSDISIGCWKDHWCLDAYGDSTATYRRKLLTATSCPDFKYRVVK